MLRSSVFIALLAGCLAMEIPFHDCGSRGVTINSVQATECTETPCTVHRGSTYHGFINFTATHAETTLHANLHGGLGLFSLPWPVEHSNGCDDLPCPLVSGTTYTYKLDMNCPSFAPATTVQAKWELKDAHHHDVLCVVIPIKIVH